MLRYPFHADGRALSSFVTVLDRIAVGRGKDAVYGLPGGAIERGETPKDALVREVSEELGLRVKRTSYVGRIGRHNLFLIEEVEGVIDQDSLQLDEVLGLGFLNSGRERRIPRARLQGHVRYVIDNFLGKKQGLEVD